MNTCSHCGAPARKDWTSQYKCGSITRRGETNRSRECYSNEIVQLRERVATLTAAGQDAVDFIDGKHAMAGRVLDRWRKATQ